MRTRVISIASILLLLFGSVGAAAQDTVKATGRGVGTGVASGVGIGVGTFSLSARLQNGVHVAIRTESDPPGPLPVSFVSMEAEASVVHRVLIDRGGNYFFGYDLMAEPVSGSKQIKISVMPFSPEFHYKLQQRGSFKNRRPHPDFNVMSLVQSYNEQIIDDGDMIALDVLVNEKTAVKLVDVIKASFDEIPVGGSSASGPVPPRDFRLDDVELRVTNYRLRINGEMVAGTAPSGGCSGAIIWFYLPERGRFIFSIKPHEGYDFQRLGEISYDRLSFTFDRDQYEWISSSPIVGMRGSFNLWVLHDPDYRPDQDGLGRTLWRPRVRDLSGIGVPDTPGQSDKVDRLVWGAADAIEYLLPRKQ